MVSLHQLAGKQFQYCRRPLLSKKRISAYQLTWILLSVQLHQNLQMPSTIW